VKGIRLLAETNKIELGWVYWDGERMRQELRRPFSTFPGGWAGIGLLLLRSAAGLAAACQGVAYFVSGSNPALGVLAGLLAAGSGASMVLGFLTPAASVLVALATAGAALAWFPPAAVNLFDAPLSAALVVVIAVAIAFLGPGSISVDCRLFGRREILIPQASHSPRR
jgi:uncharacterized membrane protein YphA (DoxX/SURF4 family)